MLENTVKNRTKELRTALSELKNLNIEIIQRLATVAEFRDTELQLIFQESVFMQTRFLRRWILMQIL